MRVWLVSFVALFGIIELCQWATTSAWLQQISLLPLPVLLAAGAALAIASNAKKHLPWQARPSASFTPQPASPAAGRSIEPQPPKPTAPSAQSISFTIRPPNANR